MAPEGGRMTSLQPPAAVGAEKSLRPCNPKPRQKGTTWGKRRDARLPQFPGLLGRGRKGWCGDKGGPGLRVWLGILISLRGGAEPKHNNN